MSKEKDNNLDLDITPEVANGTYSNLAVITHSPTEFTLDFGQILPGTARPIIRSRVIMNPIHAKRLLSALMDNVQKYEDSFGEIIEPQQAGGTIKYDGGGTPLGRA
ncbi:MAG: DUF3467 domain-containing protein [Bacteroidales bacterium]|nr:DUF3467 domain-containing protein [Bacteroidales bacterium]